MNKEKNYEIVCESLRRYMQNNYSAKNDYISACKNYRVDKYLNGAQAAELQFQKNVYEKYNGDLRKIIEYSKSHAVDVVVLKGIILAEELFNPYTLRRSLDLDILVDYKDLIVINDLLRDLGYIPINETYTNSMDCVLKYSTIRKEITHITPYKKDFGNGLIGFIEVHINFCHYLPHENRSLEISYFKEARNHYVESGKFCASTLSVRDTFIHLCAHMFRHFYWEFFRFLRGKNHFEIRMDLLFEIALFCVSYKNEIISERTINRIKELNQLEPVLISTMMANYIFDCIDFADYVLELRKNYDENHFQNDLSSDFCEAMLRCDMSIVCNSFGHELATQIMQRLRDNKPICHLVYDNHDFCEDFSLHLFNENLTEVKKDAKDYAPLLIEGGKYYISYDKNYLSISFNLPQNSRLLKNGISNICIGVCKNEDSSFFDECRKNNPQDKRFSKNMQIIYISFYENDFYITVNGEEIQDQKIIEVVKINNFEIRVKVPFTILRINPIDRRFINLVAYVEYLIDFKDAKYLRYQTKKGVSDYYALYYPWPTECGKYQLI